MGWPISPSSICIYTPCPIAARDCSWWVGRSVEFGGSLQQAIQNNKMKKSPIKRTAEKSRSPSKSRVGVGAQGGSSTSSLYYCHYKNAMYMGGIKSFKKDGRGILLHDEGVSALTSYSNDLLHGHNLFFDTYGLLSAIYHKNHLSECAYRTEGFLVFLAYGTDGELEGKAVLLNYITKSVIYAQFRRGSMVEKSEEGDFSVLNRVFELGEIDFLVGTTHARAIRYDFPKLPLIEAQKQGNRILVGFEKNGFINGLGFSFVYRGGAGGYNPDTGRQEDEFELRLVERGYYVNTQLNGMGEKVFRNGNLYVGEFRNNVFEGHGILRNSQKRNWVSGCFANGNLTELIEYNSDGDSRRFASIVQALHERKTNWINNDVPLLNFNRFVDEIEKIIKLAPNRHLKTLEQRKQEVLKKIQEKFLTDNAEFDQELSEDSLAQLRKQPQPANTSSKRLLQSFNDKPGASSRADKSNSRAEKEKGSRADQSNSKRKSDSIHSEEEGISFQARSPYPAGGSPGKLKLFEKSNSKAQSRAEPTPPRNSFSRSPGNFRMANSAVRNREYLLEPLEARESSRELKKANTSGQLGESRDPLDSKRMVGKNKIFKYLEKQEQSSPKFVYTPIDG